MSKKLILIRHGESLWNFENKYTGWANIGLTELGKKQAQYAGKILKDNKIIPQICFTSELKRSIDTNNIILNELGKNIPTHHNWRLNEKHYGKLTGYKRTDYQWKGNYFDVPPVIDDKKNLNFVNNEEYNPNYGESYYMTYLRVLPFAKGIINFNKDTLVCAHKNSLKVLIKHIEKLTIEETPNLEIENGIPIVYTFNNKYNLVKKDILVKNSGDFSNW